MSFDGLTAMARERAYERAYEDHWRTVFRFALAWTNDWGAAEDVAQEAFGRLWRHRQAVDFDRDVLPWLLVTARRLLTDRFRLVRRRFLGSSPPATLDEATAVRWLDVREAMRVLSPVERTAIILTAVEGHSSVEAAAMLGVSPGAVRAAVSRARAKLVEQR